MSLRIEEHNELNDQLQQDWQQLWDSSACGHFFNSPKWLKAVGDFCKIITIRQNGQLVAVLPLCYERRYGIRALAGPGRKHLAKATLLLKERDPKVLLALAEFLLAQGNFYLSELDEQTAFLLKQLRPQLVLRESSVSSFLPLDNDPFAFLSKKQKSKIAGLVRKHQTLLSYACHRGSKEALQTAYDIDCRSSKRREGKPSFAGQGDLQFFERLVEEFGEQVVVDLLYYNRLPVVFGLGFVYKGAYYAVNTSFDDSYRRLSPRKILLHFLLTRLKQEGFLLFDFARGQSELKREFTPLFYRQYDIYYAANPLAKDWWGLMRSARQRLVENKLFYSSYLRAKGWYLNRF